MRKVRISENMLKEADSELAVVCPMTLNGDIVPDSCTPSCAWFSMSFLRRNDDCGQETQTMIEFAYCQTTRIGELVAAKGEK